ncbi:MAG: hypothetical protein LBT82_04365 [Oscillospiraceae bacterium]|jgi:hypothetical protein|nr:hypothetical protein [Oscillospiraceae bacterium]
MKNVKNEKKLSRTAKKGRLSLKALSLISAVIFLGTSGFTNVDTSFKDNSKVEKSSLGGKTKKVLNNKSKPVNHVISDENLIKLFGPGKGLGYEKIVEKVDPYLHYKMFLPEESKDKEANLNIEQEKVQESKSEISFEKAVLPLSKNVNNFQNNNEIQNQLKEIQDQKNEINLLKEENNNLKLELEKFKKENEILNKQILELKEQCKKLTGQISNLQSLYAELEKKNQQLLSEKQNLISENQDLKCHQFDKQIFGKMEQRNIQLESNEEGLLKKINQLKSNKKRRFKNNIKQLKERIKELENTINQLLNQQIQNPTEENIAYDLVFLFKLMTRFKQTRGFFGYFLVAGNKTL